MGWNTTVVVMNDALPDIAKDPNFGKNLADAASAAILPPEHQDGRLDVAALNHINAATVIETHHADGYAVVAVGGNTGLNLGTVYPYGDGILTFRIVKELASQMGYDLHRKPTQRNRSSS